MGCEKQHLVLWRSMRIYSTSMKYFCFISVPLSLTTYNTIMSISHLTSGMQCMASLVKRPSSMNLVLNHNESLNQFNSVYIYIYTCAYVCAFPPILITSCILQICKKLPIRSAPSDNCGFVEESTLHKDSTLAWC